MKRWKFELWRFSDVTGFSGTGVVARGFRLPLNLGAFMRWRPPFRTIVWFPHPDLIEKIHGHDGASRVVWVKEWHGGQR